MTDAKNRQNKTTKKTQPTPEPAIEFLEEFSSTP